MISSLYIEDWRFYLIFYTAYSSVAFLNEINYLINSYLFSLSCNILKTTPLYFIYETYWSLISFKNNINSSGLFFIMSCSKVLAALPSSLNFKFDISLHSSVKLRYANVIANPFFILLRLALLSFYGTIPGQKWISWWNKVRAY